MKTKILIDIGAIMKEKEVLLNVNNEIHCVKIFPHETLREVLRNRLGLTGTKAACDDGSCGACTVLLEGQPVRSCLLLAVEVEHQQITTIEGLAKGEELHPMQRSFVEHHAIQCGFCSPGMILTGVAAVENQEQPLNRDEIREAISGNLCRCTGYAKIIDAIEDVSKKQ